MKKLGFLQKALIFLIIYLAISYVVNIFMGDKKQEAPTGNINLTVEKEISQGSTISINIKNNTEKEITIKNDCPAEPLSVVKKEKNKWIKLSSTPKINCSGIKQDYVIAAQSDLDIKYTYWSNSLFNKLGRYKISANIQVNKKNKTYESNEFEIVKQGIIKLTWNTALYRPILNGLIYIISILPGFSLGLAIIILTILIRTILLFPSQKAMRAQKRMQEIQPKLEAIRSKYKGNQEKIAQETMKIWKTQKVNPFGSCLPMLIQFPILIALFYVVKSGLNPDQANLLYGPLKNFDFQQIQTNFLGILELTKVNKFWLPLLVGLLQFGQMKLGPANKTKKNKKKSNSKKLEKKNNKSEMEMANNMMIYFLPVMIAMFTASLPAGVGLYWGISTSYGILQQLVINRESTNSNKGAKVKVIN